MAAAITSLGDCEASGIHCAPGGVGSDVGVWVGTLGIVLTGDEIGIRVAEAVGVVEVPRAVAVDEHPDTRRAVTAKKAKETVRRRIERPPYHERAAYVMHSTVPRRWKAVKRRTSQGHERQGVMATSAGNAGWLVVAAASWSAVSTGPYADGLDGLAPPPWSPPRIRSPQHLAEQRPIYQQAFISEIHRRTLSNAVYLLFVRCLVLTSRMNVNRCQARVIPTSHAPAARRRTGASSIHSCSPAFPESRNSSDRAISF